MTNIDRNGGADVERPDVNDPTDRFLHDVAEIRLQAAGRDAALLRLGAALMPLGVVLGVVGWILSRNSDSALDQNDALIVAVLGVTVAIVGVGLFLRYSFAQFLRFWLARLIHQQDLAHRSLAEAAARPTTAAVPVAPDAAAADPTSSRSA